MSPKPGVYSKMLKRYPLAEKRLMGATMVAVMECGHASIVKKCMQKDGSNAYSVRTHCVLCTRRRDEARVKAKEAEAARQAENGWEKKPGHWYKGMPSLNPGGVPGKQIREADIARMLEEKIAGAVEKALERLTAPKATAEVATNGHAPEVTS